MVKPDGIQRISKIDTYLNVAEAFAYRSTCIKRKYGAVIVKDDVVVSTGYNGSPRGYDNCCDIGSCPRIQLGLHQGGGLRYVQGHPCGTECAVKLFKGTDHGSGPVSGRRKPCG